MRKLEALFAVVAALLALGVGTLGSYPDRCMGRPSATPDDNIRLNCGRQPYGADPLVSLEGQRTRYLNIECLKETKDYTCEDIPEFDFGQNGTLEELSFKECPLAFVLVACVSRRLRVREVLKLTVERPSDGFKMLHENVKGLQGPRRISLEGKGYPDLYEEVALTSEALQPLSALERLTLKNMRVLLAPGALANLRALTHLTLFEVQLSDDGLPPGSLPALTQLKPSENGNETITYNAFLNLSSLEILDVRNGRTSSLDGDALAAGSPRLRELYLFGTWHTHFVLRPLGPLQHLTKVSIASFELLELSPRALGALPHLAHVFLTGSNLQEIPADLFEGSKSLITLDLSHNLLRALPTSLFTDQRMLQDLDLSWNKFETLSQELFSSLVGLRRLNLEGFFPRELPPPPPPGQSLDQPPDFPFYNALHCDCHMYHLALRMREPTGEATLPRIEVQGAECAEPLSLRGRELATVGLEGLVCDIPAHLCMRGCYCFQHPLAIVMDCIAEFDPLPQQFSKLPIELKLRVAPSSLSWIPATVQILDLSNVGMKKVPMDFNLTAIKKLDLSDNMLTRVPIELLAANVTVKLARNPLVCDCWHAEGIKQLQAARELVKDYEELTCDGGLLVQEVDAQGLCQPLCGWWGVRC